MFDGVENSTELENELLIKTGVVFALCICFSGFQIFQMHFGPNQV